MIPLIGHCTDSAANALNGLIKLASPSTLITQLPGLNFIGNGFCFSAALFAHILPYHIPAGIIQAGVLRNLMNENITIVCGTLPNRGYGLELYQAASVRDLQLLKNTSTTPM